MHGRGRMAHLPRGRRLVEPARLLRVRCEGVAVDEIGVRKKHGETGTDSPYKTARLQRRAPVDELQVDGHERALVQRVDARRPGERERA